jgi:hypothetical protein
MPVITITAIAIMKQALTATPAQITLPLAPLANSFTVPVSIRNNGAGPLTLSEPAVNVWGVDTQMQEVEPGRLFTVTLTFPTRFEVAPGQNVELSVKSNHPQFPILRVPVIQPRRPANAAVPPPQPGLDQAPPPMPPPPPAGR